MIPCQNNHNLRDYQISHKNEIYKKWENHRSIMLQMPTGTGKTRLFASIVRDIHDLGASNKKALKVLILVHREELIHQAAENLGNVYNVAHGIIKSGALEQDYLPIQIASVQTLKRRLKNWVNKKFDFIIIDEAHHALAESYKLICKTFSTAKILGVTATPIRMSGEGFTSMFDDIIISKKVSAFISDGYLTKYDYYSIAPTSAIQRAIDNIDTFDVDGDYSITAMSREIDNTIVQSKLIDTFIKYASGKKGIVYTINKQHNKHVCEAYINAGYKAIAIDSDSSSNERSKAIQDFKIGRIQILCNVNIFSEGFDCPDVEFIQLARPTMSLSLFLQQVGRGLRYHPDVEKVIFLDNVGSYNKYGLPSSYRNWKRSFMGLAQKEEEIEKHSPGQTKVYDLESGTEVFFEGDKPVELIYSSNLNVGLPPAIALIDFDEYEEFYIPSYLDKSSLDHRSMMNFDYEFWVETEYNFGDIEFIDEEENEDKRLSNSKFKLVCKNYKKGIFDCIENKIILDLDYDEIKGSNILGRSIVAKEGLLGLICLHEMKHLLPCIYEEIECVKIVEKFDQYIISINGKKGIVNESNNQIIPIEFDELFTHHSTLFDYKKSIILGSKKKFWYIIDNNSTIISNLPVGRKMGLYYLIEYKSFYGLGNSEGRIIEPTLYTSLEYVNNFYLAKVYNGITYILMEDLSYFVDHVCTTIDFVNNEYIVLKYSNKSKIIKTNGEIVIDIECYSLSLNDDIITIHNQNGWHVIELTGTIISSDRKLKSLLTTFKSSQIYKSGKYQGLVLRKNTSPKKTKTTLKTQETIVIIEPEKNNS
ncbi:MAG TPA: DEAD/DEAH box helicase [Saprospiraceae bacterium]|nr:DEAD/DEAH box helicase [Saprospiraceae bacterium]